MAKKAESSSGRARYSYTGLDRVLHERARLGILTSLATHPDGLAFGDLKEVCDLTDGNLSRHLQLLVEQRLVEVDKQTGDGRPQSWCKLTTEGRKRFLEYVGELERVVADAAVARATASRSGSGKRGWGTARGS